MPKSKPKPNRSDSQTPLTPRGTTAFDTSDKTDSRNLNDTSYNKSKVEFTSVDPFEEGKSVTFRSLFHAVASTAFFRIYPSLIFFGGWAAVVSVLDLKLHKHVAVSNHLLEVLGTIIAFIISYRTGSGYERYSEGRREWSKIIHASRSFARAVWIHVPDTFTVQISAPGSKSNLGVHESTPRAESEEVKALLEKRTVINLIEAFAVSVKHYLRGEHTIYYEDLHHLVCYLPRYDLPDAANDADDTFDRKGPQALSLPDSVLNAGRSSFSSNRSLQIPQIPPRLTLLAAEAKDKSGIFDVFPFTWFKPILFWITGGAFGKGVTVAEAKTATRNRVTDHNIPLEVIYYLSSYTAAVQFRECCDSTTISAMLDAIDTLQESLTGLERVLTTPIPWSYSCHVWHVAILFCFLLPFQIVEEFGWVTIPSTMFVAFIFLGFITIAEEIENPFGYDNNDLQLNYFVQIIARELRALTSHKAPEPINWVFSSGNKIFKSDNRRGDQLSSISKEEVWHLLKGENGISQEPQTPTA